MNTLLWNPNNRIELDLHKKSCLHHLPAEMVEKSHGAKLVEKVFHGGDCGVVGGGGVKRVEAGQKLGGEEGVRDGCILATACSAHGR